jgi:hypothetical protein
MCNVLKEKNGGHDTMNKNTIATDQYKLKGTGHECLKCGAKTEASYGVYQCSRPDCECHEAKYTVAAEQIETRHDIFTTYDIIDGLVKNERGNPMQDIRQHIRNKLEAIVSKTYTEYGATVLYDCLDYFDQATSYTAKGAKRRALWPVSYHWLVCYYVAGGSEGYYFHVDMIDADGKREMLFLGKTLIERRELAAEITAALSQILGV